MLLTFIVFILFHSCSTDNVKTLRMKVNGEQLLNEIVKHNWTDHVTQSKYLYAEGVPVNITCEALNFEHDASILFSTKNVISRKTNNNFAQNKTSIIYNPSSQFDLRCSAISKALTINSHPKKYSYILEFKKKNSKEIPEEDESNSIVQIFTSILIVVAILMILIILIKIKKWWKKKNNQKHKNSDLLSTKTTEESQINQDNCTPYAVTGIVYSEPTQQKQDYENINKMINCDNSNCYMNQTDYTNSHKEEWLSNSAYETLSNLYCQVK